MSNETGDFLRNFDAPPLVVTLQDSPRFGHSTDIKSLMGSSDEAADYTAGLIAATFVTIICFFTVFLSLPILMFLGKGRVGFLSGAPLKARSEFASSTTNQVDENFNELSANQLQEEPKVSTVADKGHEVQEMSAVDVPQKPEKSISFDESEIQNEKLNNIPVDPVEIGASDIPNNADEATAFVAEPNNNIDSIDVLQKQEVAVRKGAKRRNCCLDPSHIWVRGTFVVSGVVFILFSILLVTQGVLNLQTTIDSVNQLATDIDDLALDAEDILRSTLLRLQTQAASVRDLLVSELGGDSFCPADPSLDNSTVFAIIRDQAGTVSASLSQLNNFLGTQVESMADAISDAAKGARDVQSATEDVNIGGFWLAIILLPYTIVPSMLVLAAVLAHFHKDIPMLNSANRWFFMPFFFILVIIAAGTASGMIAAASANSDFCLPGGQPTDNYPGTSPDSTMWRVLDRKNHRTDLERQIADFYIDQCQDKPDPFLFLRSYVPKVMDGRDQLDEFLQSLQLNGTVTKLSDHCNRSYDSLDELIVEMAGFLDIILDAVRGTLGLISCSRIVPIYHRAFYDSSCAYSVSAVFWVFSSSLIMGLFGLVMLLFRAACKPTIRESALMDTDEHENVVYDEGLKYVEKRDVAVNDLLDDAEVVDANNEFTSSANLNEGEDPTKISGDIDDHVTSGDIKLKNDLDYPNSLSLA